MDKIESAKNKFFNILKKENNSGDSSRIGQFYWRKNYGVFKDLKFHKSDDSYYFENSLGLIPYEDRDMHSTCIDIEWFDPKFDRGELVFNAHIAVFHKGSVKYIFEIVEGKDAPRPKLENMCSFFSNYLNIYQIEADYILNCNDLDILDKIEAVCWIDWWGQEV